MTNQLVSVASALIAASTITRQKCGHQAIEQMPAMPACSSVTATNAVNGLSRSRAIVVFFALTDQRHVRPYKSDIAANRP